MRKLLILLSLIISGVVYYLNSSNEEGPITFLDHSYVTEDHLDTIDVRYIAWACACANWLPIESESADIVQDTACIFIESANGHLIPERYQNYNHKIRLIGKYYRHKGISRDYWKPTSQKPEVAKIFQYMYYEIL